MFRKKKDKKGGDDDLPNAPNVNDDDDAMWFKLKSSPSLNSDVALPGMGIPPAAPPSGIRMSVSPNLSSARTSPNTSSERKRFSVMDLVAAINYNDWAAVTKILDKDPKVATKNAELTLKGQKTESNPLHLLVISDPPLKVVEKMIKAYPAGASNTDRQGDRNALHWACIANASPAVLEVVAHANVGSCRHQDRKFGRTPLHYLSIIAGDPEQVQVLMEVERRASMVKDINHKTPIDLANDSSNPAKIDIVAALQQKRSSVGVFGALKSATRSRTKSPGKYKRSSSPGKYAGSTDVASPIPQGPGKYSSRESTRVPKNPGRHKDRESSLRGRRSTDGEKEGSSRGRRTTGRSSKNDSRRESSKKKRGSRADGGISREAKAATESLVVSESSEELMAPPPLAQSQSLIGEDLTKSRSNQSRSFSPKTTNSTRSRSPMPSISPPPIAHSSPVTPRSSRPAYSAASMVDRSPSMVDRSSTASSQGRLPRSSASMVDRTSTASSSQGRPSNQSLSAGMDGEVRALREKLEQKKRAVHTKDKEIAQMKDQIDDNEEEVAALYGQMDGSGAPAPGNERKLSETRDKVQRLKEQIADLQAELKRAEKDVKRLESAGSGENMSSTYIQQQTQAKEEEQGSLQFIMEALMQEKIAAQRDVDNVESELKSLETIQMLVKDDNIG